MREILISAYWNHIEDVFWLQTIKLKSIETKSRNLVYTEFPHAYKLTDIFLSNP